MQSVVKRRRVNRVLRIVKDDSKVLAVIGDEFNEYWIMTYEVDTPNRY